MKKKNVFTTKDVGDFCGVDLTTVINWIKQGKLDAYRTAGGHRRIRCRELMEFMKKYGMPIPAQLRQKNGLRILAVDDDPNILAFISQALKRLPKDYKLATAADGFEGGNKLATFNPDIVILDIKLPGIDGFDVMKKIKKNGRREVKILAITAYGGDKIKTKAIEGGADGFLLKPFSVDRFLEAVRDVMS